jgi:hypothetical protein
MLILTTVIRERKRLISDPLFVINPVRKRKYIELLNVILVKSNYKTRVLMKIFLNTVIPKNTIHSNKI